MAELKSPNVALDKAIKDLLKSVEGSIKVEDEAGIKVKALVIKTAIDWEKAKKQIQDSDDDGGFNMGDT